MIKVKRIYDKSNKSDGTRILVDRLWPRGLKKYNACIDLWMKEIAPSNELRKWFGHDPMKWEEFKKCYFEELKKEKEILSELKKLEKRHVITFLYGTKNENYNNAEALKEYLKKNH